MNINNARSNHGLARQQLELSWQRSQSRLDWNQKLRHWGAKAVAALTQGKEPQISSLMTDEGMQWRVYDPVNNQAHNFTTETEVRTWLEQRYYLN